MNKKSVTMKGLELDLPPIPPTNKGRVIQTGGRRMQSGGRAIDFLINDQLSVATWWLSYRAEELAYPINPADLEELARDLNEVAARALVLIRQLDLFAADPAAVEAELKRFDPDVYRKECPK